VAVCSTQFSSLAATYVWRSGLLSLGLWLIAPDRGLMILFSSDFDPSFRPGDLYWSRRFIDGAAERDAVAGRIVRISAPDLLLFWYRGVAAGICCPLHDSAVMSSRSSGSIWRPLLARARLCLRPLVQRTSTTVCCYG
jgi:hypothetical protein